MTDVHKHLNYNMRYDVASHMNAQLQWALRILDDELALSLKDYLSMVKTHWPKSPEYKQLQLDLAFKTLNEIEADIERSEHHDDDEAEEVRSEDESGGSDDTEMGVDEYIRNWGV